MERCLNISLPTVQLKEMLEKGTYLEFIEDLDTLENTLEYEDSLVYCIQRLFLELKEAKSMIMNTNYCLASGSIGTAEVTTATESIKRVIISIAMPLRWSFNIC